METMNYYEYSQRLKAACQKKKLRLWEIGRNGKNKEYPIYKVETMARSRKKTALFVAGIHGDEISGPLAVLTFLEKMKADEAGVRLAIIPAANPYGFDKRKYRNHKNLNLNRQFGPRGKETAEKEAILQALEKEKIFFSATLHEDDEEEGFYLFGLKGRNRSDKPFKKIINSVQPFCSICEKELIYKNQAAGGIISRHRPDGSFEERMRCEGVPYSVCAETPDSLPLAERIAANEAVLRTVADYCRKNED